MSDDEFDLSSSDEADILTLEHNGSLKRKSTNDLGGEVKRVRNEQSVSPAVVVARQVLKDRFLLEAFQLKQEEAIERLLEGESSVVVFPTGTST